MSDPQLLGQGGRRGTQSPPLPRPRSSWTIQAPLGSTRDDHPGTTRKAPLAHPVNEGPAVRARRRRLRGRRRTGERDPGPSKGRRHPVIAASAESGTSGRGYIAVPQPLSLDRRARHRPIRAEDAAITFFRPQDSLASGAAVEELARVSRHPFRPLMSTFRARDHGSRRYHADTPFPFFCIPWDGQNTCRVVWPLTDRNSLLTAARHQ